MTTSPPYRYSWTLIALLLICTCALGKPFVSNTYGFAFEVPLGWWLHSTEEDLPYLQSYPPERAVGHGAWPFPGADISFILFQPRSGEVSIEERIRNQTRHSPSAAASLNRIRLRSSDGKGRQFMVVTYELVDPGNERFNRLMHEYYFELGSGRTFIALLEYYKGDGNSSSYVKVLHSVLESFRQVRKKTAR